MTLEQDLAEARKNLKDVKAEEERYEAEGKIALPGVFILMIAAVVLVIATGSDVFGILSVIAFLWMIKMAVGPFMGDWEKRKANINAEISRLTGRKNRENQQMRKAKQREEQKQREKQLKKREQKKRARELEDAKRLMEEGGIENLNRAIGIFSKYEK